MVTSTISRRRLLSMVGALALPAMAPVHAGYDNAANAADDSATGLDEASFTISDADHSVTGLAFWSTGDKDKALLLATRLLNGGRWQGAGFVAAALYIALDGTRVALYGQWASRKTCEAGIQAVSADAQAKPSEAGVFAIAGRFPTGNSIPIRATGVAAFREFWTSTRQQTELLRRERLAADAQIGDAGVLAASIHRETSGTRVVTYLQVEEARAQAIRSRWSEPSDAYWREIARSECRLYEIVFVMAARR